MSCISSSTVFYMIWYYDNGRFSRVFLPVLPAKYIYNSSHFRKSERNADKNFFGFRKGKGQSSKRMQAHYYKADPPLFMDLRKLRILGPVRTLGPDFGPAKIWKNLKKFLRVNDNLNKICASLIHFLQQQIGQYFLCSFLFLSVFGILKRGLPGQAQNLKIWPLHDML